MSGRQPISAADLFKLDKAHDAVVAAMRQWATCSPLARPKARDAVDMAQYRWDAAMVRLREQLNGGPL